MRSNTDDIWNRALDFDSPTDAARSGDGDLLTMLTFHGIVMNGGLLNAVEVHADDETFPVEAVVEAYRFFGLESAADVIERAAAEHRELTLLNDADLLDEAEARIDAGYRLEDDDLQAALENALQQEPEAFAPLADDAH